MQKTNSTHIIISVILIVAAFVGGDLYGKGHATTTTGASAARTGTTAGAGFAGRGGARAGGTAGGFTTGSVVSVDNGTMTISLPAGGSQIVVLGTSTPILDTTLGSTADLTPGANVMVTGSANSDGSLTASSIQIRPAGMGTGFRGGAGAGATGATTNTATQ